MKSKMLSALSAAALAVTGLTVTVVTATPASALACPASVNPSSATGGVTQRTKALPGGRTLELRSGYVNGVQYAWARVVPNSLNGENIWLDYSTTSGNGWAQCDLRTLSSSGRNYGQGFRTSSSSAVVMRAGYRTGGVSYLTTWW
ncbi:hypothetical protein [Herbidospora daliensis]|uniref:hypothetical protein n=1 Tax=Herbidospora daliensis TaxID=295585 RepID=UPI0007863874|nr:hypothetical protein [Herbidospora daliensis]